MKKVSLIALDLDGTLFGPDGKIAPEDKNALQYAFGQGVEVVISSGRPYVGLPHRDMKELGIRYAITVNGGAVYSFPERVCIYSDPMEWQRVVPIIRFLEDKEVYCDVFVDGDGYGSESKIPVIDRLPQREEIRIYKKTTRTFVSDLELRIAEMNRPVQKITLDFLEDPAGGRLWREETKQFLKSMKGFRVVSGGGLNLEITDEHTSKGKALEALASCLCVPIEEVMAIGDAGNDLDMLRVAGIAVAMENGEDAIKAAADYVTLSNMEHGVAHAVRKFLSTDPE